MEKVMQRITLVSALLVLGLTGAACAESPNVATSGPYNPNTSSQAAEMQAQIPCSPDTTLPYTVDTQPKSGRLLGAAPTVPNSGVDSMRYAGRACPGNQRAPVESTTVMPQR
jgi:hypothetical protein